MAADPIGLGGPVFATAPVPDEHKVGHVGPMVNPLLQTFTFAGLDTDSYSKYILSMWLPYKAHAQVGNSTPIPPNPCPLLAYLHFTQRRNRARSLALQRVRAGHGWTWTRILDTAGPAAVRLYWLTPYGGIGAGADRRWDFRNFCQKLWIAVEAPRRAL
jgi:hypothetical protein